MNFLKNHWAAVFCALSLALLVESPLIAFPFWAGDAYRGANIAHFGTDEHLYLIRAKEALEGHSLGNPAIREGKEENQDYYFSVGEYALTAPVRWLGLGDKVDVVNLYNFYNFAGVFVLILLIYFFALELGGGKLPALATAAFVIGGYSIVYNKTLFYSDFNIYGRAMYPYVSSLAFFAYLILLAGALKFPSARRKLFAGAFFGLLFYIYFYAWTFVLALNGALFVVFALKRDWPLARAIALISAIGLLIGAYNVIRIISFVNSPAGEQFSYFSWSAQSRAPLFSNLSAAMLLPLGFFIYKNRTNANTPLFLAFILAGLISLNQQVVTGRLMQQNHYYWFFIVPIYIVAFSHILWSWLGARPLKIAASVLVLSVAFLNTAVGQYKSFFTTAQPKLYEQNYMPVLGVLNADKNPGVVFAADEWPAHLISIYTPHDLFWHKFAALNNNQVERIRDALFAHMYLNKDARGNFTDYINGEMRDLAKYSYYRDLYQHLEGYWSGFDFYEYQRRVAQGDELIADKRQKIISDLAREYEAMTRDGDNIKNILKKYGVNYILWDKNRQPEWDLSFMKLRPLLAHNNIYLYEVIY